jgi:hypothetical protein
MWEFFIVNDPDDDYNLYIELQHNEKDSGIVKWNQTNKQYEFIIYPSDEELILSCDILKNILNELESLQKTRNI